MKLRYITLLLITGTVLFNSCTKDGLDPKIDMYVHTIASENWDSARFYIGDVRWVTQLDDGSNGLAIFERYPTYDTEVSLKEESTRMIFDGYHGEVDLLAGLKLFIYHASVTIDGVEQRLFIDQFDFNELIAPNAIENGKHYRFDFTIDLDKLVYEKYGRLNLTPEYTLEVEEVL